MRQHLPASRKAVNTVDTAAAAAAGRRGVALLLPGAGPSPTLQKRASATPAARLPPGPARMGSLPAPLRQGIQALAGLDLGGVRVHHDSPMPAALGAQAYAQGHDIHLAPGQDQHLPHEAWHVVQQAQGRVAPTVQMKGGWAVNNDLQLEKEADTMGARAVGWAAGASPAGMAAHLQAGAAAPAVVQGKNLRQAGLAASYLDDGQRNAVSDGREVNLYVTQHGTKAASKIAAIQQAAALNASVGVAVDNYAGTTLGITVKNTKWTPIGQALNDDKVNKVDPFMFGVMVSFGNADHDESLELIFQHALNWTGYVEAIYDSTNAHTRAVPSMYDVDKESGLKGSTGLVGDHYRNLKFSNVHEKHKADNLAPAPNILAQTVGSDEHNLDAYTKLAGEGARWQCVRKHAANLQDDTMFYTAHPTDTNKVLAIDFRTLWITWAETFDKDYDIADATVADKLSTNTVRRKINGRPKAVKPKQLAKTSLKAKDYNLDISKSHGT